MRARCDVTETAGLLTLFDDVNKFVSVEAELVRVLGVVGVEGFALGHLRFGFRCRFGSPSSRRRPAGRWPVGSETVQVGLRPAAASLLQLVAVAGQEGARRVVGRGIPLVVMLRVPLIGYVVGVFKATILILTRVLRKPGADADLQRFARRLQYWYVSLTPNELDLPGAAPAQEAPELPELGPVVHAQVVADEVPVEAMPPPLFTVQQQTKHPAHCCNGLASQAEHRLTGQVVGRPFFSVLRLSRNSPLMKALLEGKVEETELGLTQEGRYRLNSIPFLDFSHIGICLFSNFWLKAMDAEESISGLCAST
ncbi:hypothetical protein EYF80_002238 [Liparis tanakae]|uniref:Uncharacterized protein n=1 Tax=Liparis tanakae TaxID=230148 RepID=A0A4Z2JBY4_9TELE|nr:hypothetical protein EYF80_002238 [Liparis tanakae]